MWTAGMFFSASVWQAGLTYTYLSFVSTKPFNNRPVVAQGTATCLY